MEQQRTLADIDRDIAQVKEKLSAVKGTETEVYARIVGYYRSVRNWNLGKKDEFKHRKEFAMAEGERVRELSRCCAPPRAVSFAQASEALARTISAYEFYSRKTCPNCPPVGDYLAASALKGVTVDVDTEEGLAMAESRDVFASPTVIMYNPAGEEVARARNAQELAALIPREAIAV
ncbi:MAG: hypothetical protein LBR23_09940 [Spirochaetaceae bacterium]|jgi:ribonucleoside-triphosphate reductase|nr:hypothetical protein [Spirochaetaceae bacterium]